MIELLGQNQVDLMALVQRLGFPAFRGKQIHHWLYQQGATSFDEMANLPRAVRERLGEEARVGGVNLEESVEGSDGSTKVLWRLDDGQGVEGVLMPDENRWTLCVSSQAGCALGCRFCVTGDGGFRRDLTTGEIVSQALQARRWLAKRDEPLTNLVFMGMGEPLLNFDAVVAALRLVISPQAMKLASRRMTVSTAGLIDRIRDLADEGLGVKLAVSLNATDQETRESIMPIAKANPLPDLLDACRYFQKSSPNKHQITFEYVLLDGVNDSLDHARALVRLVSGVSCKLNLIPLNPDPRLPFKRPSEERVEAFRAYLLAKNFPVAVRFSKGLDVNAACGQLALREPGN